MTAISGARLGPYEILAPLGTGGMGEVYRAKDTRLGREVAIKVLPEAFARDPDRVARFRREAQLLASFNHPNIAAIYEFDEAEKGVLFLVMELVPGKTLKQMCLERPLTVQEALPIAGQIAEALEAAHAKGVLHRDLKPSNVKVTPEKKVKLLDFGLAKAFYPASLSPDSSQSPTVPADQTRQGTVIGTAAYMSPEQARGKTLDARSDIWSFGCVLYEMLSGQKAFEGGTVSDILVAVLERQPDWDALPPDTPPAIVELLKLTLKKNVNERLEKISEARSVIDGVLGGGAPVVPRPRTLSPSLPRAMAGRPARGVLVAGFLVLAGLAAWLGLNARNGSSSLPRDKYLAILPFEDRTGQPGAQLFGMGLAESLSAHLQNVSGLQIVPPSSLGSVAGQTDLNVAKDRGANLILRSSFRREGDRIRVSYSLRSPASVAQLAAGEVEGMTSESFALEDKLATSVLDMLRLQLAAGTPSTSRKGLESGTAQEDYLKALGALQRYDDSKSVTSAIEMLIKIPGGGDSALVQAALGRAYLAQYLLTRDRVDAERAQKASEKAVSLNAKLPEVRVTLGNILTATGRAKEAVEELKRAVDIQPNSAEALLALAEAYEEAGQLAEAEASYRKAIELRPASWAGPNKLGGFFFSQTRYVEALEAYQKAIVLNPEVARLYSNVGAIYVRTGQFAQAEEPLRKSIALRPTGPAYSNLGTSQYAQGRYKEAAASFEEAVRLAPKNFRWSTYLGDALMLVPGRDADARRAYATALALGEEELRINPADARTRALVSRCLAQLGEKARAWDEVQRAAQAAPDDPNVLAPAAGTAAILGRRTEALRWLELAVSKGLGMGEIEHDPDFSSLKGDPAFQALLKGPAPRPARTQ